MPESYAPRSFAAMRAAVAADWGRYVEDAVRDGNQPTLRATLSQPGIQALIVYRWGRWLAGHRGMRHLALAPAWLLYAVSVAWVRAAYDIRLELSADIGPGLYIGHFGRIHLVRCVLGPQCSIAQQTRIAPAGDGPGPRIGARVWLGAHIVLLGPRNVGAGATLAAGTRVTVDVPEGAMMLGSPARSVPRHLLPSRRVFGTDRN